ncbi:relaxase/mobilization nuclease domain-containing protein [Mycetocola saprophilus]|uniref:relaxase/mobilization nuclease domain-containing protein n=1 Tax=Mycetocola saprophilus TaxID=76636 RepID=UPI003BF1EEA0
MMPNIVRGDRMAGLMTYLVGQGRSNEHEEPHLVAGDPALMAWHGDNDLNRDAALDIARHLDLPRKAFDTEVNGGHVWHCSLSIRAEEGMLTDEKWGEIADDFVKAMGFDDAEGTKAAARWVAVRHGVSGNGNDHIHLAVNLIREDGTKVNIHNDFHRAQKAARAIEVKHGLEQLESQNMDRATRGYDPAELEAQSRRIARAKYERARLNGGGVLPVWEGLDGTQRQASVAEEYRAGQPRYELARTVRAAATASESEGEFVRRMRQSGLLVRARFAEGTQDVVTGYSVAQKPMNGERPIWYGGGHMGRDLTLPRLRAEWPDTPQGATEAAAEWAAARRGHRIVSPGRETTTPSLQLYARMNDELGKLSEQLRSVPLDDHDTWARVARGTAGAFAAWSKATEAVPGPLANTADVLARSAQTRRAPIQPKPAGMASFAGTAMLLAVAVKGGKGAAAQALMIRQLATLAKAVFDAARASGEARQAAAIRDAERNNLRGVHERLEQLSVTVSKTSVAVLDPELEAVKARINAGQVNATQIDSPIPHRVEPTKAKQPTTGPEQTGLER